MLHWIQEASVMLTTKQNAVHKLSQCCNRGHITVQCVCSTPGWEKRICACVRVGGCMYQRQKGALCSGHQNVKLCVTPDISQYNQQNQTRYVAARNHAAQPLTQTIHSCGPDSLPQTLGTKWKLTRQAKKVQRNKARSHNHCRGRAISVTYSECVPVAWVIQHGLHMRCLILSSLSCLLL